MSKHILQWNQFQKQRLISNSTQYATSLDEIFEELIDSGIPADTMIRPTSVPTTFPMSPTAAFTSLPSPHVNRAFTPNSGRTFTPNTGQYRQHSQKKYQPRNKTYHTKFAGCPGCQADPESQSNIIDQIIHHDKSTFICLNNSNIKDKPTREAVKQENAKNPPQHGTPKDELEYSRKSPQLAVMPSPSINSISINQYPQIKYYNVHDPPHPTDKTKEDEEDNEEQSVTNNDNDDSNYED
jgi:hypothetical protein